jgi:hypothetical protein
MDGARATVRPRSRADVWRALEDVRAANSVAHPIGTTHSSSTLVQTRGTLLDTGLLGGFTPTGPDAELRQVNVLEPSWYTLTPGQLAKHLAVGSGVRVAELMATLDSLPSPRAPRMIGAYTGQTFVGALCTGTHGSGLDHGPLHTSVRSIQLLATDPETGEIQEYRIERSAGITNSATYGPANPRVRLEQDDELFRAAVVGLGCLGVVTSVILEVVEPYDLLRTRERMSWTEARALLLDVDQHGRPKAFAGDYSAGLLMNPYPRGLHAENPRTVLLSRERVAAVEPPNARPPAARQLNAFLSTIARGLFNHGLAPFAIEAALGTFQVDDPEFGASHVMLGSSGDLPKGWSVEYSFPLRSDWVKVFDTMLDRLFELGKTTRQFLGGTISVRFVQGDDAHLSMTEGRDSVFFEFLTLAGVTEAPEVFEALEAIALDAGARPHWGQWWSLARFDEVVARYERFPAWRARFLRLNQDGLFDNAFAHRVRTSGPG